MKVLVNSDGDVLTSGGKAIKSSGGGGGGNYNIVQTVNGNNCSIAITDQDVFVLQDKTVTTNGQHTADAQYSGLGTVTVNVPPTPTQSKNMVLGAAAPATVTPDSGYDLSSVVPQIDTSVIKAENIAQGVQMLGITGTHQGGGGGARLPDAYQEVQYITGTGTQYIDTGIQASSDINSCIKFSATQTGSFKVIGIYEAAYHTDVFDMDSSRFRFTNYGEAWYGGTISADTSWHYVVLRDKDGQYIFDDIVRKTKTDTWSSNLNYYIFNSNGDSIPGSFRLSSLRMYRNSTDALIRDFVPCYRVSDREAGLYDLVSATFFTNDGTGNFLIGPPIGGEGMPSEYQEVQYIGFASEAYIDMGTSVTGCCVEASVYDESYVNDKHWFGNSQSSMYFHFTTYSNTYYWGRNYEEWHAGSWTSGAHTLVYNSGDTHAIILDGVILSTGSDVVCPGNALIGKRESYANCSNFRLYSCKVTQNSGAGAVIRNYIPCYRKSDNVVGLYDTMSHQFYLNSGSGSFTAGPDVN